MRRILKITLIVIILMCYRYYSYAQTDTLWVSDIYTTHIIFDTDLTYVDLSNGQSVAAKIIDQMEMMNVVGPKDGQKARKVLISRQEYQELVMGRSDG